VVSEGYRDADPIARLDRTDPGYPACLDDLPDAPRQLFAIGDRSALDAAPAGLVAIVGTREASSYGLRVAKALGQAFAKAGAVVVSGMARGVDSAAHEGALYAGGRTIAVLGTGPDVPYPAANRGLHRRVIASGLVLSENEPGRMAYLGCFPRRNRIIAALARATIVVEAGHKSGALNTAGQALDLGRSVAAIPGPIDSPRSAGSNQLIRDGGQLIGTVDDALGLLGLSRNGAVHRPEMGAAEAEVWDCLGEGELPVDAICTRSGLGVRPVLEAVSRLELAGLVARLPDGQIGRVLVGEALPVY
jgi:DNA processing protein